MIRVALREGHSAVAAKLAITALAAAAVLLPNQSQANDFCPDIYRGGVLPVNFNPAFTHIDEFNLPNGGTADGLVVTSFFNSIKNEAGTSRVGAFERDLVARINGIGYRWPAWWNADRDVEVLTDLDLVDPQLPSGDGQTNWPNEAERVPDGVLAFESIVIPQGFHPATPPGRLTLVNLDDASRTEYIIDQSIQAPESCNNNPNVKPRFYHQVHWVDMDEDGYKDAVTVRSGFKVAVVFCVPAVGEVVWFKNPGPAIDPAIEWEEHVIADVNGADIALDVADLENDGVVEIVGGNFFTGELISMYGAPVGQSWATVNPTTNPPRITQLSSNQGRPFSVRFVDLNNDGDMEVLATNHQSDNCFQRTQDAIPGRVYALEQPANGDIFGSPWTTHILKDNIRPNPTYPAVNNNPPGPGRLAPGLAQEFWASKWDENFYKPMVLVGGDEASKVWLLKPVSEDPNNWNYDSAVIFDINDTYGANTSQSFSAPAPATGVSISTIGGVSWRYDRDWVWGSYAEIYIPVFEGRDIHRITFRPRGETNKIACPADGALACPAP